MTLAMQRPDPIADCLSEAKELETYANSLTKKVGDGLKRKIHTQLNIQKLLKAWTPNKMSLIKKIW